VRGVDLLLERLSGSVSTVVQETLEIELVARATTAPPGKSGI
jgi:DNA-binding LacI/PurR family transcriptional regulator